MSTFIGLNDSGSLSVMTHLGRDTSDDAIKREIRKSTGKDPDSIQWSRITKSEADEILRGLVVGEAEADPTTPPDVGVDMSAIIDELARLHARCDSQEAATAEINKVLDEAVVERLVGIEEKR